MKGLNYYHPPTHTHTHPYPASFHLLAKSKTALWGGDGQTPQRNKMSYAGLWRSFGLALILSDFVLV